MKTKLKSLAIGLGSGRGLIYGLILRVLAGIGGLLARSKLMSVHKPLMSVLLLPLIMNWLESQIHFSPESHKVKSSIEIAGSKNSIWNEIQSVKPISKSELSDSWVHKIGFPRPLSAEIDKEQVGGIRNARFERGLVFSETVDEWQPQKSLSFRIKIDPKDISATALDEHVSIGGPFFDVLRGTYTIDEDPSGKLTLRLESEFRLSTHFNFYASIWTDLIMHQIQSDILKVIKQRAERD